MLYHTLTKQEIYKCSNPCPIKELKVPANHCVPQSLCLSSDGLFKLSCCYFCWHFGLLSVRSISSCLSFGLSLRFSRNTSIMGLKKSWRTRRLASISERVDRFPLLFLFALFPPFSSCFLVYFLLEKEIWFSCCAFVDFMCYIRATWLLPRNVALLSCTFPD